MSNWTEGYFSNINYTTGYYGALNPQKMIVPLLRAGIQPPEVFNACELGFGMGLSLNIHAVSGHAKWYGTDFNPSHALFAQHLANQGARSKVLIADQSFSEFCNRDDLPEFDFIALHGIFSWISPQNQAIIIDFVGRKLKVGGVLYISYNTLPGWSSNAPIRHLISQLYKNTSAEQNVESNIKKVLGEADQVIGLSPRLSSKAPMLRESLEKLNQLNMNYVAHEYLNEHWHPLYFSEMNDFLKQAKLDYACSSSYLDDYPNLIFTQEQKELMAQISDPTLQQTVKDYMLCRQFRADYWVKGKMELSESDIEKEWRNLQVMRITPNDQKITDIEHYNSINFNSGLLEPILDKLADHKIHRVSDLCDELAGSMKPQAIFEILSLLEAKHQLVVSRTPEQIESSLADCLRFNRFIMDNIFGGKCPSYLASPVSGGAIYYTQLNLCFLSAYQKGLPVSEWESYTWSLLQKANQVLIREGNALSTEDENREEIRRLLRIFEQENVLGISQGLMVI